MSIGLAKNLPLDMAEDAKVGSKTSSTTRSAKNLSASLDIAKDVKLDGGSKDNDKTVKKSPFYTKLSKPTGIIPLYAKTLIAYLLKKIWAHLIILTIIKALS